MAVIGQTGKDMLATIAWAQDASDAGSTGSTLLSIVPFVLIFVIFYLLLILPQQKRQKKHREMLDALKKGDKVVTSSGIWGTVTNMAKNTVTLQIADNTKVKMQRDGIARFRTEEED